MVRGPRDEKILSTGVYSPFRPCNVNQRRRIPRRISFAHIPPSHDKQHYVVNLQGMKSARLDRFHLIVREIGILSFGHQVSEFLLPFNHLYQACSGPGLREVPVDTFQLSGSPEGFSCTNLPTSCTWRKVVDGYK